VSVFTSSLRFVRRFRLPGNARAAYLLSSGAWVVSANIRTPTSIGLPFHVLDADGNVVRSFGPESSVSGRSLGTSGARWFALSFDESTIWSATDYRLERMALTANVPDTITVTGVPWLTDAPPGSRDTVRTEASRRVVSRGTSAHFAGVDTTGLIWMSAIIAAPDRAVRASEATADDYSFLTEVLDPVRGELLVSRPATRPLMFLPHSNLAVTVHEDQDGVVTFVIHRMQLRRPSPE
jgi:hypothetical protein